MGLTRVVAPVVARPRARASTPRRDVTVPRRASSHDAPVVVVRAPRLDRARALALGVVAAVASVVVVADAGAVDVGFCVATCARECARIAPGSDAYCSETCADECAAMVRDGVDVSENGSSSVFTTTRETSGMERALVGIIDKSAVFFAPGAELAKDPACAE
ncbi:unnamed product [Ostreococcus tauri]|uniref:Unnamed product n=1 Tax=Ostreococcus tauri TaxID=70448 RepID=A0A096P982_OSTTA|nr:unnamed product [Ostreococcus tauri]CEG00783.1 unnamed product [Ostreococcus tauri]|eukprot:XP_022840579.1 unnamed product [Ostreococcus tauri]